MALDAEIVPLLDVNPDIAILLDGEGKIYYVNAAGRRALKIDDIEEISGRHVQTILWLAKPEKKRILTRIEEILSEGKAVGGPVKMQIADDPLGMTQLDLVPLDGRLLLVGRKKEPFASQDTLFWESLERVWDASRTSVDLMQTIPLAVFICSARKGGISVLDCNNLAERLTGAKLRSMQGKQLKKFLPDVFEKGVLDGMARLMDTEENIEIEISISGKVYLVLAFGMSGRRLGIIFNDITNMKKAERVLEQENVRLKMIDEKRKEFISIASHELKTPLVSTCGASEFLLKTVKAKIDDEEFKLLEIISRGCKRLHKLTDTLLDYSRLELGELALDVQENDLVSMTRHCIADLEHSASSRDISLSWELPESCVVPCDKLRIEQVLGNLITNAINNTPPGGDIFVKMKTSDDDIIVSIRDSGVGLVEEERDVLFTKFGKIVRKGTDMDINIQGTGLGLYISKEIIDLHGGSISAASPGRHLGSTFEFSLPLIRYQKEFN